MNQWEYFRNEINNCGIGERITRKELVSNSNVHGATIDNYRNMSEKLGYLTKGPRDGIYIVVKHIPLDISSNELRKQYDERIW